MALLIHLASGFTVGCRRALAPAQVRVALACCTLLCLAVGDPRHAAAEDPIAPEVRGAPTVCLLPMGKYEASMLDAGRAGVEYLYGFPTRVLAAVEMPAEAWYAPRKRYRADALLDWIEAHALEGSGCDIVVGFTQHDISVTKGEIEDWGIFGLGALGGHEAMVSTKRLGKKSKHRQDKAVRTVKVVNHEIGHVLGIPHIKGEGCLMNDAEGTIATVDAESGLLCPSSIAWIESSLGVTLPHHDVFEWEAVIGAPD